MSYHSGLKRPVSACVRVPVIGIHPYYSSSPVSHYPRIVGRYRIAVGRYRTKVSNIESTRPGLLRTSKISRIDPIVAKLR